MVSLPEIFDLQTNKKESRTRSKSSSLEPGGGGGGGASSGGGTGANDATALPVSAAIKDGSSPCTTTQHAGNRPDLVRDLAALAGPELSCVEVEGMLSSM